MSPPSAAGAGMGLCLLAAVSYAAAPILGKLAYDEGLTLTSLLAGRFAIAAFVLWLAILALGAAARPSGRGALGGVILGIVFYAGQNGLFFAALERIDATLATLLVFVAPAMVAGAAVALGRERLGPGQLTALPLALGGTALVLLGGGVGTMDALGVTLALGCAVVYSAYMLITHAVVARVEPLALSASICLGALIPFAVAAAAAGESAIPAGGAEWGVVLGIALLCTVVPVAALTAGTARVGPSTATILATTQPLFTAALAFAVLGESLTPLQLVGGALVLGSVLALRAGWPIRASEPVVRAGS